MHIHPKSPVVNGPEHLWLTQPPGLFHRPPGCRCVTHTQPPSLLPLLLIDSLHMHSSLRHGSRGCHGPGNVPVFHSKHRRVNAPLLRTILCVKAPIFSFLPPSLSTLRQHFPPSPALLGERAPAPLTHSSAALLPSLLLWSICGTRLWLQPFGSWPELPCGGESNKV